jgi:hypothetical protein
VSEGEEAEKGLREEERGVEEEKSNTALLSSLLLPSRATRGEEDW